MSSKILSEYVCKKLFFKTLNKENYILRISKKDFLQIKFPEWTFNQRLVCKVDQEIKHRAKNGLVLIDKSLEECLEWIKYIDYNDFIIEPFVEILKEFYLFIKFNDDYDKLGIYDDNLKSFIEVCYNFYSKYCLNFMEINPLAKIKNNDYYPIDFAVKYDITSNYKWNLDDLELLNNNKDFEYNYEVENKILKLDESCGASFKFKLLNPDGKIWTLVAGGGASVLYTDALINLGLIDQLANYGEYSGAPTTSYVNKY